MHHQNQRFTNNVANYLANHSIIVPLDFGNALSARHLNNGVAYQFDLQIMTVAGSGINVQPAAAAGLVILTQMAHRGRAVGGSTNPINAMWLDGPGGGANNAPLPGGVDYIFTESLGGCSLYINAAGQIVHNPGGALPGGVLAGQAVAPPYAGAAPPFDQTCGVAYRVGGVWHVGTSVPHDAGPLNKIHAASGYQYSGY
jgi:hypothetical protein